MILRSRIIDRNSAFLPDLSQDVFTEFRLQHKWYRNITFNKAMLLRVEIIEELIKLRFLFRCDVPGLAHASEDARAEKSTRV